MPDSSTNLSRLLQENQVNDALVAEEIVRQYYATIYRLVYSIVGNGADADDIVQETFIAALNNLDRYEPGTNFKAWLSTIAVNRCRDVLRKQETRRRLKETLRAIQSFIGHSPSAEKSVLQNEAGDGLWTAVHNLGEKHRLPVLLRYVHDLSIREIAQILGIKEGTVHSRLHYACQKLARSVEMETEVLTDE